MRTFLKKHSAVIGLLVFLIACDEGDGNVNTPAFETYEASNTSYFSALLKARFLPAESSEVHSYGFTYSTESEPTLDNPNDKKVTLQLPIPTDSVKTTIYYLSDNTIYFFRPFIKYNSGDIKYGPEKSFKTKN